MSSACRTGASVWMGRGRRAMSCQYFRFEKAPPASSIIPILLSEEFVLVLLCLHLKTLEYYCPCAVESNSRPWAVLCLSSYLVIHPAQHTPSYKAVSGCTGIWRR